MTTGFEWECMVAAGCTTLGSGSAIGCVILLGTGFSVDLTGRGEGGFLAARVPIFSDLLRGDGGDCCRYGKDLGEYIMPKVGSGGVSPVTNDRSLSGTARMSDVWQAGCCYVMSAMGLDGCSKGIS